jgi:uncharacterized protein (DUF2141 family)
LGQPNKLSDSESFCLDARHAAQRVPQADAGLAPSGLKRRGGQPEEMKRAQRFRGGWSSTIRVALGLAALAIAAAQAGAQREDTPRFSAPAAGQPLCTLLIHVTGFRNQKGVAGGTVFASPDGWPEETAKALVHGPFPIQHGEAMETFRIPPGRYAIAVIHDENANHKLDRNLLGIPKEGFGFANNPKVLLSAPSFNAAAAQVTCPETQIEIHLIYK